MILRGAIGSTLVLLGGLVTQVLPWSSPIASAPLLATLRDTQPGRMAGLVVVVAGLALLGSAWLRLLSAPLQTVHLATIAWCLPLLLAPPLFSRDGWSYAAQGELTHIGLSPYVWTPSILSGQVREGVDPLWMNTPTPYGPVPLAWGSWVAGITDNAWLMVVGYRVLGVVGLLLLAWAVPRLASRTGQDPARASAIVLASPLTVVHGIGGVHNDLVMAGLMAAAVAVALDRPWVIGAALAGAAAAVKLPGGVVAIGVALVTLPTAAGLVARLRRLTSVGAVAVGVLVGSGVAIGVGIGWVHALDTPGIVRTPLAVTTQVGAALEHVGPLQGHAIDALRAVGVLAAVGLAVWIALRGRTGDRADVVRSMALLTTAVVVLSPAVHGWYLLWALPFLAACRWGRPGDEAVRDAALLLGIIAPLDSSLRGAPAEILVVVILVVLTAVRLRAQAGQARRSGSSLTA